MQVEAHALGEHPAHGASADEDSRAGMALVENVGLAGKRRARILVGGTAVRRMLAKGVGLDLHPDLFAVGRSAATMIGHLSVLLTRTGTDDYEILVTRSFAEALWDDLETLAREYL